MGYCPCYRQALRLLVALLFCATLPVANAHPDLAKVTLQLEWKHQFEAAGYYMAIEKGFYREQGLEVSIQQAGSGIDPIAEVVSGRAEYGVEGAGLISARLNGEPVVVMNALFQHSPAVWLTPRDRHIETFQQLARETLEAQFEGNLQSEHFLPFLVEGIRPDRLVTVPRSFGVEQLISGKIGGLAAWTTNQPFLLQQAGFEYDLLSPADVGLDYYGGMLFTSEHEAVEHQERVLRMRMASLQGWKYALEHPDEAIELIINRYNPEKTEEQLRFEAAAIQELVQMDFINLGHINPLRLQKLAGVMVNLGLAQPHESTLDGFVFTANEAERWRTAAAEEHKLRLTQLAAIVGIAILLIAFLLGWAIYSMRMTRRMQTIQKELRELATRDALTGVWNRRETEKTLQVELARSERYNSLLSLIMLDVDHFKRINDRCGHPVGDSVLIRITEALQQSLRESDVLGRWGGEEFLIVCPNTGVDDAASLAERCREQVALKTDCNGEPVTISLGVVQYKPSDTVSLLVKYADDALYAAKAAGRNQVQLAERQ